MKIYCSGIGGIGLSAYAALQRAAGHTVVGSDRAESALLDDLRSQDITVIVDQSGKSVPSDADLFVYSEAIPADAPERRRARDLGIREISYPHALGEMSTGSRVIAVCGTHGKSSTTAMCARLLTETGKDPTVVVGTKLKEFHGRNWRKGKSDLFLLEACEYRNSFHHYRPEMILLTNCDGDHFDWYATVEDYQSSFVEFIRKLPEHGTLITHMGDPDCRTVAERARHRTVDADAQPLIALQTPGAHMQANAQLALALAGELGIPPSAAERAVCGYEGSWRRMELTGHFRGLIPVIDDYGHHPREIRATIQAIAGAYPGKRIVCAFQPHTHDRTLKLYDAFTECFRGVDTVILPNVYDARHEIESGSVDVDRFVADIGRVSGVIAINGHSLAETERLLRDQLLTDGDLLLCMGAGDITSLAQRMAQS